MPVRFYSTILKAISTATASQTIKLSRALADKSGGPGFKSFSSNFDLFAQSSSFVVYIFLLSFEGNIPSEPSSLDQWCLQLGWGLWDQSESSLWHDHLPEGGERLRALACRQRCTEQHRKKSAAEKGIWKLPGMFKIKHMDRRQNSRNLKCAKQILLLPPLLKQYCFISVEQ